MHYSMKSFSIDIETRLNAAYGEGGAPQKFGFDDVISSGRSVTVLSESEDGARKTKTERKIEKLANEASKYLQSEKSEHQSNMSSIG